MIDTLFSNLGPRARAASWRAYGLVRAPVHPRHAAPAGARRRPELLGRTLAALGHVARALPVLFPMHPRTKARIAESLEVPERVLNRRPAPYTAFLSLEVGAAAVITDSGGVQEETTALGVPCFTLRDNTERPVTVTDGSNVVLGLEPERLAEVPHLLRGPRIARRPALWDGRAGGRCADAIERALGVELARTA